MLKDVLLCYDGSVRGRRALRRAAELAILVGARIHVLSIVSENVVSATVMAGAMGHVCLVDEESQHKQLPRESLEWFTSRGVTVDGHLAYGDTIPQIVAHAKKLAVD